MNSALLGNVIVAESSLSFKLFSSKDQSLVISWDTFFVLNFGLDALNSVTRLDLEGHSLAGKGSNENLHVMLWVC